MTDDVALRELILRYRRLRTMGGRQAQGRGQEFNTFLRDLLRAWGLEAHADQRGLRNRDETDVGFSVGRAYYILEAKWTKEPINLDPVAKLYLRLRVRPPNTAAVLVSMAGFTGPVREFTEYHPEIILLDRTHIEAMLTGLVDPDVLLHLLFSWTSRRGGSYVTAADLLLSPYPPNLPVWTGPGDSVSPVPAVTGFADTVGASVVLTAEPQEDHFTGMSLASDRSLLLTCGSGVQRLDPRSGRTSWELPLAGTRTAVAPGASGGLLVACESGIVSWDGEQLLPVAGAFRPGSQLITGPAGSRWVFSTTGPTGDVWKGSHTLTRIGERVGDETHWPIEFSGQVKRAALTGTGDLYLGSGYQGGVLEVGAGMRLDDSNWFIAAPLRDLTALLAVGEHTVLSAGASTEAGQVALYSTDLRTGRHSELVTVEGNAATALAGDGEGGCYLLLDAWIPRSTRPRPVLMHLAGAAQDMQSAAVPAS
ncbi:restriction endonuclease [Streptacidiphilus sp. EB103A]|uniref:restriction endonuclease n=1 Tax=Streptacidiphilus sp. EB103A TaxID=3156275 RepID=UPI0035146372